MVTTPTSQDLTAWLHNRWAWEYGECDHGTFTGGPQHGQPYAMCERWGLALSAFLGQAHDCRPRDALPAQVPATP